MQKDECLQSAAAEQATLTDGLFRPWPLKTGCSPSAIQATEIFCVSQRTATLQQIVTLSHASQHATPQPL